MLSVFQLGRFVSPFKIGGTRVIDGFRILRRSAKCTRRPRAIYLNVVVLAGAVDSSREEYGGSISCYNFACTLLHRVTVTVLLTVNRLYYDVALCI